MKKAIIDRIEDGKHAVLLIGEEETEKIVPLDTLPIGAAEGSILCLSPNGSLTFDENTHNETQDRVKKKMELLRKKNSKFKK